MRVTDSKGPVLGDLPLLSVLPPEALPGSHGEDWRKISWCFQEGRGVVAILKYAGESLLLRTGLKRSDFMADDFTYM